MNFIFNLNAFSWKAMQPNGPSSKNHEHVCHYTLPWLISISLDGGTGGIGRSWEPAQMTPPKIVALREGDLPAAAAALSRAFQDDPLQTYVLPDPVERAAQSPGLFAPLLRYGLNFGEVLTTEGSPVGAAVWLGPEAWEVTPERATAAGLDKLPAVLGAAAAERFFSMLAAIDPYHHRDVPPAHWYVMVVGVAPEKQGKGIGRALLQPIIERADTAGQPCYLETAQPENIGLYERLGFRRVVDMVEPQSGLRLWTFRRDPAAPR